MHSQLQIFSAPLPAITDGLQSYLQQVNAIPLLSHEQEQQLASRYRQEGDLMAAQQLVLSHLRYVVRIARDYQGYGLALLDLIQEGSIGLMKAVKRFDPTLGVRLASFAVHWIKSEIHEFVIRNWRMVKIATTKAQRKLFFNLRKAKKRLGWFSSQEVQALANDLGVTPKEVLEMETRLNACDESFSQEEPSPLYYLPASQESEPEHILGKQNWNEQTQVKLEQALTELDSRSLDIVAQRWLNDPKASLKELSEKYHISIERVRQLEKSAIAKLKAHLVS